MITGFLTAIAFLTRLPVGRYIQPGPREVAQASRWFPFVGALLGAISMGCLRLLHSVFPAAVCAIFLVALDAALTGAMHFDGLADTADGFGGGATRDDRLRIMRDHAIGSYGAVAIGLAMALKLAALDELIARPRVYAALLIAPLVARWSAVLLGATQPYARPIGEGAAVTAGAPTRFMGRTELIVATIIALAIALAIDPLRGAAALLAVAAGSAAWAWFCRHRIGGVTGDTLGAAIEVSECLVLLLFTLP